MSVGIELEDLFFGWDDAEMDVADGGLLLSGFLRTPAFKAARTARKHLIIGRKGSGKSAICRTLVAESGPDLVTALVTPDTVSADEIRRFELQGVDSAMAKRMLWRYILTVQIAKHLVAHTKSGHNKTPASVSTLQKFLVDNGELDTSRPKLFEIIGRLKGALKLEAFGVSVEVTSPSEGTHVDDQLDEIEKQVKKAIGDLACPKDHPRLLLLVDQLEDVWSEQGDSDSLVIGLLKAARAVGSAFKGVSCVLFLRSDIYDPLKFADKDKYHSDEMRVDWSAERLAELVLARAQVSLGEEISEEGLWGGIFPATVGWMPTRDYLIDHTLMRPRDVIHLCNQCRDIAEYNGHPSITEADIAEAIRQYSQWKLEDLPNEYLSTYPFLGILLEVFKDHGYVLTRAALDRRLPGAVDGLADRFPDYAAALTTANVLDLLYGIGFLGVRRNDNTVYATRHSERVEMADTEFRIHPAFRSALRATSASITWNFEPSHYFAVVQGAMTSGGFIQLSGDRLVDTARDGVDRLFDRLGDGLLPREVRQEIRANLRSIHDHLGSVASASGRASIEQVDQVRAFLAALAARLEADGFAEEREARYFVRSIEDLSRRLQSQIRGDISEISG